MSSHSTRSPFALSLTLAALGLSPLVACGDDSGAGGAGTGGDGGATTATASTTTTTATTGSGGGEPAFAPLFATSSGTLLRARLDGIAFTDDDDDVSAWRLEVAGAEVDLGTSTEAGVVAVRSPDDPASVEAVVLQARVAASAGDEAFVEHLASGRRWRFEARSEAGSAFTLHPIVLRTPSGGGTGESDVAGELTSAWAVVESQCGVSLRVEPPREVTVDDPDALIEGIAAIDDPERPADIVMPRAIDDVMADSGAPDDGLRLIVWPSAKPVAVPVRLYEFAGTQLYEPTVLVYDAFENGAFVGGELSTERRHRFALASDQDSPSPAGADWPWAVLAVHEVGHLLGLSHPDQTVDDGDDYVDDLMAGAHDYPASYGELGQLPSVTQRQCLLLALDLNGYAAP